MENEDNLFASVADESDHKVERDANSTADNQVNHQTQKQM